MSVTYDYFGVADMLLSDPDPDPSILSVFQQDKYLAVRVLLPVTVSETETEPSIHLGLMIDVSDSMSEGRLDEVKHTLHAARNSFRPNDRVTLVVFGETGQSIVVNHRMDDAGKIAFYTALDAVETTGCTNMSAGFEVLNTVQPTDNRYDSVILLTDGEVNRGIESIEGLTTMACAIGGEKGLTFHTLGYGAIHNRALLRVLSTQTCGIYQWIQSDEQVSSSFGDILGNTRATVIRNATLQLPDGWTRLEVSPALGDIVPGRECWAVYERRNPGMETETPTVRLQGWIQNRKIAIVANSVTLNVLSDTTVHILRARVSRALTDLSNILESRSALGARLRTSLERIDVARNALEALRDELKQAGQHPLVLRMKAQIAEALVPIDSDEMEDSLARLSSGAAALSTQRAVSDPHTVESEIFTSPAGRTASSRVHAHFTGNI